METKREKISAKRFTFKQLLLKYKVNCSQTTSKELTLRFLIEKNVDFTFLTNDQRIFKAYEILKQSKPLVKKRNSREKRKEFYTSHAWNKLKKRVLKTYGLCCMKCEATDKEIHVDHIKPRSKYPELGLSFENMQVLCKDCNYEKSNVDETDYRPKIILK